MSWALVSKYAAVIAFLAVAGLFVAAVAAGPIALLALVGVAGLVLFGRFVARLLA